MRGLAKYAVHILICMAALFLYAGYVDATEIENGIYAIDYKVLQADSDSVSIANDYFLKPAVLKVEDGQMSISFTVNQSKWVKSLSVANGESFVDVHVISANQTENTRNVSFKVNEDLSQPVFMQMHIQIEDMVPAYSHHYTVRYAFDLASIEAIDATSDQQLASLIEAVQSNDSELEENPSKNSKVIIYLGSIFLIIIFVIILRIVTRPKRT